MVTKPGYKDCPRCGLRNRISAASCDFCGYAFEDATDEWNDYLEILAKLGKEEVVSEDDEFSAIKSTIVRPLEVIEDDEPQAEETVEDLAEVPAIQMEDEAQEAIEEEPALEGPVIEEPAPEALPGPEANEAFEDDIVDELDTLDEPIREEAEEEPSTFEEEVPEDQPSYSPDEAVMPDEVGEEITEEPPEEIIDEAIDQEPMVESEPEPQIEPIAPAMTDEAPIEAEAVGPLLMAEPEGRGMDKASLMTYGMLASGVMIYSGTVAVAFVSPFNLILEWGAVVVGGLLLAFGLGRVADMVRNKRAIGDASDDDDGREVVLCPVCYEEVSGDVDICPRCGAEFSNE